MGTKRPGRAAVPAGARARLCAALCALTAMAAGPAAGPEIDLDAPIPDLPFEASTVETLCRDLRSQEVQAQYGAARYFLAQAQSGNLAQEALSCLLHAVEHGAIQPVQAHAGFAVTHYGAASVRGLLEIVRRSKTGNAYWVAVGALESLGPEAKAAENAMLRMLRDRHAKASERLDAAEIVWAIGDPEAREVAYRAMLELAASGEAETRGKAAFSLVRTGRATATAHLARCAQDHEDPSWRLLCMTELGNVAAGLREPLDPTAATSWLQQLREDPHAEVRRSRKEALERAGAD